MGSCVGCRKELNIIWVEFRGSNFFISDVALFEVCSKVIVLPKTDWGQLPSELFGLFAIVEIVGRVGGSMPNNREGIEHFRVATDE
jgi:hypothetical protein